jgi:integral membrane protein (TIGR01906 family)
LFLLKKYLSLPVVYHLALSSNRSKRGVKFKHWAFWSQRCKISDRDGKVKVLSIAAKWLFMLCLPLLLLTASIGWAFNSLWLYQHGFEKYNVSQTLANSGLKLTDSELENIYAGLISYFNSHDEYISITVAKDGKLFNLFTPEETIHFRDVKGLIWLDYWVLLGTSVYALAYAVVCLFWRKRRYWRYLAWGLVGGGSLTLALILLVFGLGTLLGFSQLLYWFHLVFFTNPYWSAEGYMLLLFPEEFLRDAALFCALITAGLAIILGGVGGYLILNKKTR